MFGSVQQKHQMRYLIPSPAMLSNIMVMLIIIMMMIVIIPAKVLHVTDLMKPIALDLHLCPCAIVQALVQTLELMEK